MNTVNPNDYGAAVKALEIKASSIVDFGGIFRFFEMLSAGFTAIGNIVSRALGMNSAEKTKDLLNRIIEVLEKGDDALLQFRTLYKKLPKHIQEAYTGHSQSVPQAFAFFKNERKKLGL